MKWPLRAGAPVRRPFVGVEFDRLTNGWVFRLSLWPMRLGVYFMAWREI